MTLKIKNKLLELKANKTFLACCLMTIIYLISGYCKWLEILMSVCTLVFMSILPLQSSFCIFTFSHCFTLSNIGYDSCFMVTLIGYCIILLVKYIIGVRKKQYTFHKKIVLGLSWFLAISMTISLFNGLYRGAWLYLTYIPLFYLIFAMKNEFDIVQGMNYMLGGFIASVCLSLLTLIFPYFQYEPIFEGRFRAFINNTNYMYMRALFLLSFYMYRYLVHELSNLKFVSVFLFCSLSCLATLSKTGIGMLALITLLFVIYYLKQDFKKNIKVVGIFFLIILIVGLIGFKFILKLFDRFASDFNSGNFWNSLLTGRDDIWKAYISACFENPFKCLFGHGILAEEVFIPAQQITRASHNLYIFMLYRFGIVGCIVIAIFIYKILKQTLIEKPSLFAWLPLIYILIESLFDNTFKCYHFTYFLFAVMVLFVENGIKTSKIDKENQNIKKINKI